MEASVYNETFVMPADEKENSLARLLAVLEEMMETAGRNAAMLGAGMRELHANGLTWVLARLHVEVSAAPPDSGTVHISTWPAGRHRLFAVREFQVKDGSGLELLRATSAWAMMNIKTRRPSRLDPLLPVFSRHPQRTVADDFSPLPPVAADDATASYRAAASDIDLNDHVNNTVYLNWALNAVHAEMRSRIPISLEAAFVGEARLGDKVICLTQRHAQEDAAVLLQSLRDAASGRELTRLRSRWEAAPHR